MYGKYICTLSITRSMEIIWDELFGPRLISWSLDTFFSDWQVGRWVIICDLIDLKGLITYGFGGLMQEINYHHPYQKGRKKKFFPFGGQERVVGPFSHHHMHNTEYTYVRPIRYSMLPPTTLGGCPTELVSALMNLCTYQTHRHTAVK